MEVEYLSCLHCQQPRSIMAKGLCRRCYDKPGVRERYPRTSYGLDRRASRQNPPGGLGMKPPTRRPQPTETLPGTVERMDVYTARLEAGEELFHPQDRQWHGEGCMELASLGGVLWKAG